MICRDCSYDKIESEFYKDKGKPRLECKSCVCAKIQAYRRENIEKLLNRENDQYYKHHNKKLSGKKKYYSENKDTIKIKSKINRDLNKEEINSTRREKYKENPDKYRNTQLKSLFGLTLEEYRKISEEQSNLCAICCKPETQTRLGKVKKLAVDHNHETGKVRGLLCARCNKGIGLFLENKESLLNAIEYINCHNKKEK